MSSHRIHLVPENLPYSAHPGWLPFPRHKGDWNGQLVQKITHTISWVGHLSFQCPPRNGSWARAKVLSLKHPAALSLWSVPSLRQAPEGTLTRKNIAPCVINSFHHRNAISIFLKWLLLLRFAMS